MSDFTSFKQFLKEDLLSEAIPTVWDKKVRNVVSQEDEEQRDVGAVGDTCGECGGEGVDNHGETCWECQGKGVIQSVEDEEEMEDEDDLESDDMEDTDEDDLESDDMEDTDEDGEPEDPNHQGVIRKVKDAHLVYKRQDEEGTYEELWMYKAGEEVSDELDVRRDVLAGTDIPPGKTKSKDNTQKFDLWTSGNVQFLHITGLPN